MGDLAIRAEGLSKRYTIGQLHGGYDTLREHIVRVTRSLRRAGGEAPPRNELWALRDVSFEIAPGEVVGFVGRNGAGKTTLLRLLSRITEPTSGHADLRGRLGSLLEVGTGFHPELTGRENILLNGSILGMRRAETLRKFDEIVEFAGVSTFIDTPVKRYSSGMYVRLAFSVAAHLDPEILLVDEVLAVGDAEFQRKCLGKMDDIGRSGRTVILVSHNMPTITRLCERALLFEGGRLVLDGPSEQVVASYLQNEYGSPAERAWAPDEAPGNGYVRLRSVRVVDPSSTTASSLDVREAVGIEMSLEVLGPGPELVPWIALYNDQGGHIFSAMDIDPAWRQPREPGRYTAVAWIPPNLLNEGLVVVSVSLNTFGKGGHATRQAHANEVVAFNVVDPAEGDSARGSFVGQWTAPVRPLLEWQTEYAPPLRPASPVR